MYKKTTFLRKVFAFALILSVLSVATPQNIYAANEIVATEDSSAEVEFDAGELSLVQVAAFDFGQQDIATGENHYTAVNVGDDIQVSDLRGNGYGWDLNVSLSEFIHTENNHELAGAFVTLSDARIAGVNGTVGTAPTSSSTSSLVIESDGEELPIFTAGSDAGMGVWGITTELAGAELTVPAGATYAGSYEATLTWTLQTTP